MAIQNISFSVGGQKIKYSTFTRIVANSVNVVTATFSFTQEWENYIKKAIFSIGDISKTLILTENTVEIPSECLTLGTLCVSVVGVIDEPYSRLTTEKMHGIPVIGSGALNGDTVNVPTPTEGEQVVLLAQSAVDTVDSALSVANGIDAKATQALSTANGIDAKATQALADAQAAINAVNAPDFSTTTLTALSQIATVTDSYSGVAEFTASGNTMQQVLVNGDFAQGTTGWTADSASISAANKILTITGNGLSAFPQAGKTEARIIVNGKYFIKGRCRLNTAYAGTAFLAVQIKGTTGGSFVQKIQDPIVGTWYDIYAIADASTFSGNIRVILYGQFADAATANGKVIEVDGNVGVFAIPTTGTPFENKATSEINANISEYWGGLKSVEKVEVVSRGRNLFDG
ncbi:MAG: hypothetical protein EOM28_00985, partial [Clostridia bacterium]|nr:hypothetical protein [Clostridia bacterium]